MAVKDSNTRVQVTFTREQVRLMKRKAEVLGVTLSQYIVLALDTTGAFRGRP